MAVVRSLVELGGITIDAALVRALIAKIDESQADVEVWHEDCRRGLVVFHDEITLRMLLVAWGLRARTHVRWLLARGAYRRAVASAAAVR